MYKSKCLAFVYITIKLTVLSLFSVSENSVCKHPMKNNFSKDLIPPNEEQRLQALKHYQLCYTEKEEAFDSLIAIAANDFNVPYAIISLVDKNFVYFKSSVGFPPGMQCAERALSFCSVTILSHHVKVVENAKNHPALSQFPVFSGENGFCFYAGAPLVTNDGFNIGTICLIDKEPRTFTAVEEEKLQRYARAVMHQIEINLDFVKKNNELKERKLQLRQALNLARIGTWEYDVATKKATWSDELYTIYGLDKTDQELDLIALYLSMVHPDDLPKVKNIFADVSSTPSELVLRFTNKNGENIFVKQSARKIFDDNGELIKLSGISRDITDQMVHEEKLRTSEERFRSLVQNSSDMIGVIDMEGNYQYVAESVFHILGYHADFFKGKNALSFIHPDDLEKVGACFAEIPHKKYLDVPPFRFMNFWGEWAWIDTRMANLLHDPVVNGLVVNSRDITEWVELQERYKKETAKKQKEITAAVIKAQETERAQVGQELHDNVNQVLTTVKLYNEMIAKGLGNKEEIIAKSEHYLQQCIDEIRSISKRLSAPTLGDIKLEDSIKELVESINFTNTIKLDCAIEGLATVQLSQEAHLAVYRIIQEQLNNIIKYAEATWVSVHLWVEHDQLMLSVIDNGKGFDVNAKRAGIGITNMRTRAENLNGIFDIVSSHGAGCQLRVQLPL